MQDTCLEVEKVYQLEWYDLEGWGHSMLSQAFWWFDFQVHNSTALLCDMLLKILKEMQASKSVEYLCDIVCQGHRQNIEIHGCAVYPADMVWPLAPRLLAVEINLTFTQDLNIKLEGYLKLEGYRISNWRVKTGGLFIVCGAGNHMSPGQTCRAWPRRITSSISASQRPSESRRLSISSMQMVCWRLNSKSSNNHHPVSRSIKNL